ncbi:ABC-type branched-chain amino acid transport systems, ATPase component [Pyrobaculum oguniense TE7]|uniref:Probable branched-chain amino acid transport ATP-binding protein LivG n=1 Tax=Pyrobaculum oguniense (strain DSM 13380 / JCM 10595 / TE7) TaxID=698757 RepID=H6QDS3_PYROT|nr:ABC-type branched-chain amino acid transport systems, ATPase component [Pyrobaculum oguniense TE7]
MALLTLTDVYKSFGGVKAVDGVSMRVEKGEIIGLIGPNGAGKTTLVNIISGFYKPDRGEILFNGSDVTTKPPYIRAKLGIARTFQNPRLVSNMTALLNVAYAVLGREDAKNMSLYEAVAEAIYYLDLVGLLRRRDVLAKDMPLYELRLLELARALALRPKLLLIDEVMAGLNPAEAEKVRKLIINIKEQLDLTIIWIEHVLKLVMKTVDRVVVMHYGKIIAEGSPKEVAENPVVIEAYTGKRMVAI